ncbi:MAG: UDP-N-acetylmuramate dehydrogenase [Gammaproteobacteria bacterium]|nr:UDP-N-acetylmuramate dehydrogenase [Gammaproteobacteria bacterium]
MSKHTSWRVGGPADYFFKPADVEDLANFLTQVPADMPLHWLGLGSNLLVRDGGIRGVVILTSGLLNHIEFLGDGLFRAEAGVACAKLARQVARMNFAECEFLAGIPGTIGGALAMNAGAFGGETWEKVEAVETLDRQGRQHLRRPDEYQIAYRQVSGPANEWFIAGHFRFNAGNGEETLSRIKELLAKRNASQPTNQPSCGSVFRNPEGDFAARLIEQCGLKGTCIGGACVSQKHANFIVNTGNATAADIESLIELVARTVKDQQGVDLIREAHIMGEKE